MNKTFGFALVCCLSLVFALAACANDSSNAGEAGETAAGTQTAGDAAMTPSAEAYAQLQTELLEIQKTATNQATMMEAVSRASEKL